MKRTKIVPVNRVRLFPAVTELEEQGLEIIDFKPIYDKMRGEIVIFLMAQKEEKEDKNVYEKMYLLEQYCANYRADANHLCEGCGLEILCDKYEGNSSYLWNFEDVEKAYELIGGKDE